MASPKEEEDKSKRRPHPFARMMAKSLRKTTKSQTKEAKKYCEGLLKKSRGGFLIIGKSYCPYCIDLENFLRKVSAFFLLFN